ncbi:MAG: helix-turn-helix domain-containing protein [Muribaculaceae bacterium]|nr:helix-turn-helix domain-containing protein [Muribaculaceae bacterium]
MEKMKTTSFEELKNRHLGEIGTPGRDAYEAEVRQAIQSYHIGEAIKAARKERNMTQDQLAELMGVKKAQVSRIERGANPTLNTITRAFHALGLAVSLTCGNMQINLG